MDYTIERVKSGDETILTALHGGMKRGKRICRITQNLFAFIVCRASGEKVTAEK